MTTPKNCRVFLLLLFCSVLAAAGCTSPNASVMNATPAMAAAPASPAEYTIQPGDQLEIKLFYNPELNELVTVRPDGKISLQLLDDVQAAYKTPSQLDAELTDRYSRELKKPAVTVIVREMAGNPIYVGGEVNNQGLTTLTPGMTALQAVINAGGFRETADPRSTIIIRKGDKNEPVPIRVDLTSALAGGSTQRFHLAPHDVVYVPKSPIAKANKFVNQYIEELFLFRGVSLGFSYQLHSDNNNNNN